MFDGIDFSSDTRTVPSLAMKQFMMSAAVGDEQIGEDPSTKLLEETMALRLGKSAAMFFPSATMCNQIAVKLHCQPGEEVIGAESCHIFAAEAGGAAFHAGVQTRMIPTLDGTFTGAELKNYVRASLGPLIPKSRLLLVENTSNAGGGVAWPLAQLSSLMAVAKELGLKTHLDGARLFNAALATKSDIKSLAAGFDTVSLCFSKALGCAIGAILAFDQKDWHQVRRLKQVFGGALRQSGILAAGCLYALEHNVDSLIDDHNNAHSFSRGLSMIAAIKVENKTPSTNMVFFSVDPDVIDPNQFLDRCLSYQLRFSRSAYNRFRAVTHRDISAAQINEAVLRLEQALGSKA